MFVAHNAHFDLEMLQQIQACAGPYQGAKLIDGAACLPYQPTTFPTRPFPEELVERAGLMAWIWSARRAA